VNNAPEGVVVCIHLYQNYNENSNLINQLLVPIAKQYQLVKFLRSVATKCVENFPDERVPTIIVYKNGQLVHNLVNVDHKIKPLNMSGLVTYLKSLDVIPLEDEEEKPFVDQYSKFMLKKDISHKERDLSDSDEDDRQYTSTKFKGY